MNRKIIHDRFLIIYFHFSFDIILFLFRIDLIIYFFLVRKTKQVELLIFISVLFQIPKMKHFNQPGFPPIIIPPTGNRLFF
jgi:hypothetical protein